MYDEPHHKIRILHGHMSHQDTIVLVDSAPSLNNMIRQRIMHTVHAARPEIKHDHWLCIVTYGRTINGSQHLYKPDASYI